MAAHMPQATSIAFSVGGQGVNIWGDEVVVDLDVIDFQALANSCETMAAGPKR